MDDKAQNLLSDGKLTGAFQPYRSNFCGDLHASCLMQELKKQDKEAEFRFYGGEEMKAGGGTISNRKKIGSDKRILFRSSLPIF